jgi:hypothetical protein
MPAYSPEEIHASTTAASDADDPSTALHEKHASARMPCPHDGTTATAALCWTTR